jgi:pantoate--beta-alanine ligase
LEQEKVDLIFAPSVEEMYGKGENTWVTVEGLSDKLDGRSRPGHFRGVTTVVAKLFHIVEPDVAFFGQKDAAQVAVIRHMVRDLKFPVEIAVCPVVREPDGLAMSSRNGYLSPEERQRALVLQRSLRWTEEKFRTGERDVARLVAGASQIIAAEPQVRLDFFEIVDPDTLEPVTETLQPVLVAVEVTEITEAAPVNLCVLCGNGFVHHRAHHSPRPDTNRFPAMK